jgi:protein SCO1
MRIAAQLQRATRYVVIFLALDVTGADFGRDFRLTDHRGKVRTLADFHGKYVVLFFGYTHCPDYCPTTLQQLAKATKMLGDSAAQVQVLFVTVDPERDTSEILARYATAFDPSFLALTGSQDELRAVAKEFHILFQKTAANASGNYSVDHSAGTYVYDSAGRLRLYMAYGMDAAAIAHDLKVLIQAH